MRAAGIGREIAVRAAVPFLTAACPAVTVVSGLVAGRMALDGLAPGRDPQSAVMVGVFATLAAALLLYGRSSWSGLSLRDRLHLAALRLEEWAGLRSTVEDDADDAAEDDHDQDDAELAELVRGARLNATFVDWVSAGVVREVDAEMVADYGADPDAWGPEIYAEAARRRAALFGRLGETFTAAAVREVGRSGGAR